VVSEFLAAGDSSSGSPAIRPAKLGKLDNHKPESRKLSLPRFIKQLYCERCGTATLDDVASIEEDVGSQGRKNTRGVPPGSSVQGTAPEAR
jgi:hypothetical protein